MNKAVVILDYNNVFCQNYNLTVERRKSIMLSVIRQIVIFHPSVDFIEIRIYGGWYQGFELTRAGSQVMSEHLTMELFPILTDDNTIIQGEQSIVQSISEVDFIWYNTYREKQGLPRLIINREARKPICDEQRTRCPIHILESFARKASRICSVEGCLTNNSSAFVSMGQKMVDTMMVCDILTYSTKPDTQVICVLTDDVDLFPALALCHYNQPEKELDLGIVNGQNIESYQDCLHPFNVNVFQIYDVRRA